MAYRYAKPASDRSLGALTEYLRRYGGACVVCPRRFTASAFASPKLKLPSTDHEHLVVELLLLEEVERPVKIGQVPRTRFQAVYFLLADPDEPSSARYHGMEFARAIDPGYVSWVQSDILYQLNDDEVDMGIIPDPAYLYCVARGAGARQGWRWWVEMTA